MTGAESNGEQPRTSAHGERSLLCVRREPKPNNMNSKTLTALKQSIAHWKRMATGKARTDERPGSSGCALCKLFKNTKKWCRGCPVYKRTGITNCISTPYFEAASTYHGSGIESGQFKLAARIELKFLQSLLPKRKTTKK